MVKGHRKSDVLRLDGKGLSHYSTDLETLSEKIPHFSKNKIKFFPDNISSELNF